MVNNSIQPFIAGFLANKKKPLKISDFIIAGSNSLQLISISYLPMQKWLKMFCSMLSELTSPAMSLK